MEISLEVLVQALKCLHYHYEERPTVQNLAEKFGFRKPLVMYNNLADLWNLKTAMATPALRSLAITGPTIRRGTLSGTTQSRATLTGSQRPNNSLSYYTIRKCAKSQARPRMGTKSKKKEKASGKWTHLGIAPTKTIYTIPDSQSEI